MNLQGQNLKGNRSLKRWLVAAAVLALVIAGLQIWVVNNARSILKQFVESQSHGALKLELSHLRFNFFTNELQVLQADVLSTDSISQPASYHAKFSKLTLRVHSFLPLLLKKDLLLDSILLQNPQIEVMQWRKDTSRSRLKDELSISQEMGKLYNSMLDVLERFGIRRIVINNAQLSLVNKMNLGSEPVTISNIYFDLLRAPSKPGKRDEFIHNEQSVSLSTTNQNIALPGGRHRLSFKTFNLELFRKRIELNDCTVTAIATDSTKSSYKIFFKKLLLIGVDFAAMDKYNLIKADSVYCEKPLFNIHLEGAPGLSKKKAKPDPEKIIRELSGDLDLAFIGVKDAGINIDIIGKKSRSLLNSKGDNFEMRGLRINADSTKPVVVKRFDMLVRDYHLYNEDSSIAYAFDSIRFINSKILLNNFAVTTVSSSIKQRSTRDFRIRYFELTGLNWYQLIFEENLQAEEAFLKNPVITYIRNVPVVHRKKANLFSLLQGLDTLMTLNKVNIVNGTINMNLGAAASIKLQGVDLKVYSNKLLQATNKEGLQRSVDDLSFSKGFIRLKDMTAQLENVRTGSDDIIYAGKLILNANNLKATASDVVINNMLLNNEATAIEADGLEWKNASVNIQSLPGIKNKKLTASFEVKNILGKNTTLIYNDANTNVYTNVLVVKASSIAKKENSAVETSNFFINGRDLSVRSNAMQVNASSYELVSNGLSYLRQVKVQNIKERDSLIVQSPLISFSTDVNRLFTNNIQVSNADILSPVIKMSNWNSSPVKSKVNTQNTSFQIDRLTTSEPDLNFTTHRNDSVSIINIPHSVNSGLKASGISVNNKGIQVSSIALNTTAATFTKPTGEILGVDHGKVAMQLSAIKLFKQDDKQLWSAILDSLYLQNPRTVSIGKKKNKLLLNEFSIGNINLSSGYVADFSQLMKFNISAWLRGATGKYVDSTTTLHWYNAAYNSTQKKLNLDSFSYYPTQPKDSVIAHTPYEIDYITFHSGAIKLTGFDAEKYTKDTSIIAESITINDPVIGLFRDKQPPLLLGKIKPMPVTLLQNISLPLSVQSANITNGRLTYTEKNAKTREEGTLLFTGVNGGLQNIKNIHLTAHDSLALNLNGYLMDSVFLNLTIKESYLDSLKGFVMTSRMKGTPLSLLNPVLLPLSNIIITSGSVDSLNVHAIGRHDLALGEMNLYYHNLHIKLVKDGNVDEPAFKTKLINFLVNTFVIKNNNTGSKGLVFVQHLQDRSFFNYIVKMTFSGIATSVGIKKNSKYMKQYRQELEKSKMPAVQ